ncbi:hypothetical protein [Modestobacter sp. SYSU DS0657]
MELQRLGSALSIPTGFLSWTLFFLPAASMAARALAAVSLSLLLLISFGTSSRELALVPLLMLGAWAVTRGRPGVVWVLGAVAVSAFVFSAVISWRLQQGQGIRAYIASLTTRPGEVMTSELGTIVPNLLAGFPNASFVLLRSPQLTWDSVVTAINPLPASWLGYSAASSDYSIVSYIPYGTVGTLANVSSWAIASFYFFVSGLFAFVWRRTGEAVGVRLHEALTRPMLIAGAFLVCLLSIQYQVRATARAAELVLIAAVVMLTLAGSERRQRERRRVDGALLGVANQQEAKPLFNTPNRGAELAMRGTTAQRSAATRSARGMSSSPTPPMT